jgi:hypothetical protein
VTFFKHKTISLTPGEIWKIYPTVVSIQTIAVLIKIVDKIVLLGYAYMQDYYITEKLAKGLRVKKFQGLFAITDTQI